MNEEENKSFLKNLVLETGIKNTNLKCLVAYLACMLNIEKANFSLKTELELVYKNAVNKLEEFFPKAEQYMIMSKKRIEKLEVEKEGMKFQQIERRPIERRDSILNRPKFRIPVSRKSLVSFNLLKINEVQKPNIAQQLSILKSQLDMQNKPQTEDPQEIKPIAEESLTPKSGSEEEVKKEQAKVEETDNKEKEFPILVEKIKIPPLKKTMTLKSPSGTHLASPLKSYENENVVSKVLQLQTELNWHKSLSEYFQKELNSRREQIEKFSKQMDDLQKTNETFVKENSTTWQLFTDELKVLIK